MTTFSEILDAADGLSVNEQETLPEILRHRIAQRNRAQLVEDMIDARREFASGQARVASVKELRDEVRSEA